MDRCIDGNANMVLKPLLNVLTVQQLSLRHLTIAPSKARNAYVGKPQIKYKQADLKVS